MGFWAMLRGYHGEYGGHGVLVLILFLCVLRGSYGSHDAGELVSEGWR